jgi:hypothetical protein
MSTVWDKILDMEYERYSKDDIYNELIPKET